MGYPVWGFRIEKNLQILDLQRLASLLEVILKQTAFHINN